MTNSRCVGSSGCCAANFPVSVICTLVHAPAAGALYHFVLPGPVHHHVNFFERDILLAQKMFCAVAEAAKRAGIYFDLGHSVFQSSSLPVRPAGRGINA